MSSRGGRQTRSSSLTHMDSAKPVSLSDMQNIIGDLKRDLVQSFKSEFSRIESHLQSLEARIGSLESSFSSFQTTLSQQQSQIDEIKDSVSKTGLMRSEILDEVEDREKRRNNVIVFGVEEREQGSLEERREHDIDVVNEVLDSLGFGDVVLNNVHRLGRTSSGKFRPLKVPLVNYSVKASVLQKSRLLKQNDKFKNVYITNDRTKLQQSEWSELRAERDRRKQDGEDVVIYNGKVCSRTSLRNFRA